MMLGGGLTMVCGVGNFIMNGGSLICGGAWLHLLKRHASIVKAQQESTSPTVNELGGNTPYLTCHGRSSRSFDFSSLFNGVLSFKNSSKPNRSRSLLSILVCGNRTTRRT
jgi:hypothetical protein